MDMLTYASCRIISINLSRLQLLKYNKLRENNYGYDVVSIDLRITIDFSTLFRFFPIKKKKS